MEEALIFTQLKIMEIAPLLLDLYARICSLGEGEAEDQAKDAAQAILQQWEERTTTFFNGEDIRWFR